MTHKEAEQSLDRYRQLADSVPLLLCSFSPDGTLTVVNEAYCQYFQKTREELVGVNFFVFIPEEEREAVRRHLASFTTERHTVTYEHEVVSPSGQTCWQRWTDKAIFDDNGNIIEFHSAGLDITAEKQLSMELKQRNDEFEYIMDMGPALVYTCKAHGDFDPMFVSNNVRSLFGYEPKEFLQGATFWKSLVHPEDLERILSNIKRIFVHGRHSHEYRFLHKDGRYRWVHDELRLIRDESGKPLEIIGIWVDISDKKSAEEKTQEMENTYNLVAQASSDGICQLDHAGKFSYVNESCAKMLGYDYHELVGKKITEVSHEDYMVQVKGFSHRLKDGNTVLGSFVARHKFGHHVPLFVHFIPVLKGTSVERIIGVIKDLSSSWESEQQLRQQMSKIHALEHRVKELSEQLADAGKPTVFSPTPFNTSNTPRPLQT